MKPTTSERYSDQIVAAMKKGRVLELAYVGEPRIRFQVKVGRHLLQRDMDFTVTTTEEQRGILVHNAYRQLLREALDLDAQELLKVAQCPKCREWFPSFEERNEHKREHVADLDHVVEAA